MRNPLSEQSTPTHSELQLFPTQLRRKEKSQVENPQSNFDKIMSIPKDIPIRQCKSLIHTLCENFNFQKTIITSTMDTELPKQIASQIKKNQTYNNYKEVLKYARRMKQKKHFNNRKFILTTPTIKHHMKKLQQIVQDKKNQMLLQESPLCLEQEKILCILNDNKKREKLFEEALLIQRLQEIKKQKQTMANNMLNGHKSCSSMSRYGNKTFSNISKDQSPIKIQTKRHRRVATQQNRQLPQKMKGINPKHIRLLENNRNEEQFHKNKYICNQRKLRFYNYAYKIERTSLKAQKKQNSDIINTILDFNEKICTLETQNSNGYSRQINRLFLQYSNKQAENPQNLYTHIKIEKLQSFMKDFSIDWQSREDIQTYIKGLDYQLSQFQFVEILFMLGNTQKQVIFDFNQFLSKKIFARKQKVVPPEWRELQHVKKTLRKQLKIFKFEQIVEQIFKSKVQNHKEDYSLINFNDITQLLWDVKLFPVKISKKIIRFIYLYSCSESAGLNLSDLQNMFLVIAISCGPKGKSQIKIKWLLTHLVNKLQSK